VRAVTLSCSLTAGRSPRGRSERRTAHAAATAKASTAKSMANWNCTAVASLPPKMRSKPEETAAGSWSSPCPTTRVRWPKSTCSLCRRCAMSISSGPSPGGSGFSAALACFFARWCSSRDRSARACASVSFPRKASASAGVSVSGTAGRLAVFLSAAAAAPAARKSPHAMNAVSFTARTL